MSRENDIRYYDFVSEDFVDHSSWTHSSESSSHHVTHDLEEHKMRASAVIRLRFPSERHLSMMLSALKPETESVRTSRAIVRLESKGNSLTMRFEAGSTSALRAAINSYLHWVALVNEACSVLESLNS